MIRHMLLAGALLASVAVQAADRSRAIRGEFQREHPCPSTGTSRGACPNWHVDHRIALCAGGADRASNLQWLTVEEHKAKTRSDVRLCRSASVNRAVGAAVAQ